MSLIQQRKHELLAFQDSLLAVVLVLINPQSYNDSAMKKTYNYLNYCLIPLTSYNHAILVLLVS